MVNIPYGAAEKEGVDGGTEIRHLQFLERRQRAAASLALRARDAGLEDIAKFEGFIARILGMQMASLGQGPGFEGLLVDCFFRFFANPQSPQAQAKLSQVLQGPQNGFTQLISHIVAYWHGLLKENPEAAKCFAHAIALQHPTTEAEATAAYGPIEEM